MLLKPIFRSKAQRDTLADRERMEAEEAQLEAEREARRVERKQQSKLLVVAELTREVAQEKARAAAAGVDSDADMAEEPIDEELELDLWKLRELRRLKRDRDERKLFEEEEALTERRRNMTDDEIRRDNARLGLEREASGAPRGDDKSMRFMQRYYHKGGFFQDEESIKAAGELSQRDFHAPTGMDRTVDISLLPKVMQVKKFAMKGRTKCKSDRATGTNAGGAAGVGNGKMENERWTRFAWRSGC
jgi:microfibrillar-associated protein 1